MNIGFSVKDAVNKRYSVRTFDTRPVGEEIKTGIMDYVRSFQNPLGPKANYRFIEKESSANGDKLGTYGIITGANLYLGVTIPDEEGALEALGYDFEQLVLYIASLGLGTCWLGGTFNKGAFAEAMDVKENEMFPIVSPVGYPSEKMRVGEKIFRKGLRADKRVPWSELFFMNDFNNPLTQAQAGEYQFPLEMLRLAPSAVNKQPWRVVYDGKAFHFFEKAMKGADEAVGVDMQRIDVGIAICHFHLAAIESNLSGRFEKKEPKGLSLPQNTLYVTSWVAE